MSKKARIMNPKLVILFLTVGTLFLIAFYHHNPIDLNQFDDAELAKDNQGIIDMNFQLSHDPRC